MNKVLTSDKYTVTCLKDGYEISVPVYISLLSCGKGNGFPLPEDVKKKYDGLGRGTKTVKTFIEVLILVVVVTSFLIPVSTLMLLYLT